MARMLLDAGAPVDVSARGDGGTPLIVALFWGNRATAELLAAEGVHPRNLRAAAGLGALELIDDALAPEEAGAHRGFYRPHSGFPAWQPSDDPQEVLDEALAWAARSDRADASSGSSPAAPTSTADVYRGTALAWAAARGHVATIRRLVALGADPNQRITFGGPQHGEGRRRCTSRPRTGTWTRSARCSSSAPTGPRATGSTTRPRRAGRSTAARPPPVTC